MVMGIYRDLAVGVSEGSTGSGQTRISTAPESLGRLHRPTSSAPRNWGLPP